MTSTMQNTNQQKYLMIYSPDYIKEISYYKKFENIEKIFNTPDKCNEYLYQK